MTKSDNKPSLNRRRFLQGSAVTTAALGGSIAQAADANERATRNTGHDYDVIVVGGGFAGVTAARDCRQKGYKTLLIEARNRLGGRAFTTEFEGHQVELGGTWIHWTQPNVWAEKERYDLDIIETPPNSGAVKRIANLNGSPVALNDEDLYSLSLAYRDFCSDSREIWERPYDIKHRWNSIVEGDSLSAADKLNQMNLKPQQRALMETIISTCAHNTADKMSYVEALRWMSCPGYSEIQIFLDSVGRYKLKDGTIALIDAMIADATPEVRLSTTVTKIESAIAGLDDTARITTRDGQELTAAAVIVTLPMNVIGGVEFIPALPSEVILAGKERHTGSGVKVYAKTAKRVENTVMFGRETDPINSAWTFKHDVDHSLVVCFGNDAETLDIYDEKSVQEALARFVPDIEVQAVIGYDWNLDPNALGTFCSYRPGWMETYYDHFQQDMGRVLMASGDHGEGWRGFIDGAIREGARAAQRSSRWVG